MHRTQLTVFLMEIVLIKTLLSAPSPALVTAM
jgi:hypothetical protein